MSKHSFIINRGYLLWSALLLATMMTCPTEAIAVEHCPTSADEIATDRPDVTNSSVVAPYGSLQAEDGIDSTVKHGSNLLNGTNTRVRPGITRCTESLIDVPSYFLSLDSSQLAVVAAASGPEHPC